MFTIKISGIPIAINNKYSLTETFCSKFRTDQKPFYLLKCNLEKEYSGNPGEKM